MKKLSKVTSALAALAFATTAISSASALNVKAAGSTKEDWKKDTSSTTISWFVEGDWYHKNWDTKNCLFDKMVTKATGVKVKVTSGTTDKLTTLIASNQLPDVVTAWYIETPVQKLQQSGRVWAIDELIKKYAPNFDLPKSMRSWHKQDDGHLYGIVNYFYAPEEMKKDDFIPTHFAFEARKDIMDKLKIKASDFNTKAGTLAALKKVKNAKLKYNGLPVIPCYFDTIDLTMAFGGSREDKNGNYVDRKYTPESLEATKFMNQLYREGLLPVDTPTATDKQKEEKVDQGIIFAFSNTLLGNSKINLYNNDKKAVYVPVGPVRGDAKKQVYADPSPMAGWTTSMISKKAKNPSRIIRFFEYLYNGDEMDLNTYYGPKGAAWNYDSTGHVKLTSQYVKDAAADPSKATLKYGNNTFAWLIDWIPILKTNPTPTNECDKEELNQQKYFGKYSYSDFAFSTLTNYDTSELSAIAVKVDDYEKTQQAKMILAPSSKEVEKMFKEMLKHDKELGYDKVYSFWNKQFKAAKKKLGIKFAWPENQK